MGRSHIIVALDFACINQARAFVSLLSPDTCCLKVGKQMFTLYGPSFVNECVDLGFDVFLDLKFHDIPNTVSAAVLAAAQLGVWMQTLHIQGGVEMLAAACSARDSFVGRKPLLVGVTMLTSLSDEDVSVLGYSSSVEAMVLRYAQLAFDVGLDGVVCSAFEARILRERFGSDFLLVTPGIVFADVASSDQKRSVTPLEARSAGSDYLVIGRSITQASDPIDRLKSCNQLF